MFNLQKLAVQCDSIDMSTLPLKHPEVIVNEVTPGVGVLVTIGEAPEPTCPISDSELHIRILMRTYELGKGMGFPESPISPEFPQIQTLHALLSGMQRARQL